MSNNDEIQHQSSVESRACLAEDLLERFDEAWQNGAEPSIPDVLKSVALEKQLSVLLELIGIDLEWRWRRGERVLIESYCQTFRIPLSCQKSMLRLIEFEIGIRASCSCLPDENELKLRFPQFFEPVILLLASQREKIAARSVLPLSPNGGASVPEMRLAWSTDNDPVISRTVEDFPNYIILGELGRGAFAVVFLAKCRRLGRDVAIKRPHSQFLGLPEQAERLLREAKAAARLQHPSIVPIHEIGTSRGQPFIVMEYIEGQTLADVMATTSISPPQGARWVKLIAEALDYAHQCGVIHRDVKPSNILIGTTRSFAGESAPTERQPFLSDFGLALQEDAGITLTQDGDLVGTPAYASPEQARGQGHHADRRSDVYSLGVVLFEILCGRLPFQGSGASIIHQILTEDAPTPGKFRRGIPPDLETICLKAMSREPSRRYPSAGAMAADLNAFLENRPIEARRIGTTGRLIRWCRRYPALAATIFASMFAILVISVAGYLQVLSERDRYLSERDRAQENLYRALVSDAQSQLRSRDTDWWRQAMNQIGEAAELKVQNSDREMLRELAIQCMGTRYPSFQLQTEWQSSADVTCLALSADGEWVCECSSGRLLTVRSTTNGSVLWKLQDPRVLPIAATFHPLTRKLAVACLDGNVQIWNLESLAGGAGQSSKITSEIISTGSAPLSVITYSSEGETLAVGGDNAVIHLIDLRLDSPPAGDPADSKSIRTLVGHSGRVISLSFSPDGRQLASGSVDLTVRQWETMSGSLVSTWNRGHTPLSLTYVETGKALIISEAEAFGYIERSTRRENIVLANHVHTGAITCLAHVPQMGVLTCSDDGTIRLFSHGDHKELAIAQGDFSGIRNASVNIEHRKVAAAYADGRVRLWEFTVPSERLLVGSSTQAAAFLGSTHQVANGNMTINCDQWNPLSAVSYVRETTAALAIHPSSQYLLFGNGTAQLQVSDLKSGEIKGWKPDDGVVRKVAISRDGRTVATASDSGTIQLREWPNGEVKCLLTSQCGDLTHMVWNSDQTFLAVSSPERVGVIFPDPDESPVWIQSTHVAGSAVAAGTDFVALIAPGHTIEVHDSKTGVKRCTFQVRGEQTEAMLVLPDGRTLMTASTERTIQFWDTMTGQELPGFETQGQDIDVNWMAVNQSGTHLATGGEYGPTALWDLKNRYQLAFTTTGSVCGEFLPDQSGLILKHPNGGLLRWDFQSIEQTRANLLAGEDVQSSRLSVRSDTPGSVVAGSHSDAVWGVAASPDGRWFATASHDSTVKIWRASDYRLERTLKGHSGLAWCVAFSPDSTQLASGGSGLCIWDVATGEQLSEATDHQSMITSVVYHPDGKTLFASDSRGRVSLRRAVRSAVACTMTQFSQPVHSLAVSPAGEWLVAGCHDQRIAVWHLQEPFASTRLALASDSSVPVSLELSPHQYLVGHRASVRTLGFSASGRMLASGSDQGAVILWNGKSLKKIVEMKGGTGQIRSVGFSHDHRFLLASAYVSPMVIWDLNRVQDRLNAMKLDWQDP